MTKRTLQYHIIERIFNNDEKKMEEFYEDYKNVRLQTRNYIVTKQDLALAHDWKKGMTTRELSQKYKMTQSRVDSRIKAVARDFLRKS